MYEKGAGQGKYAGMGGGAVNSIGVTFQGVNNYLLFRFEKRWVRLEPVAVYEKKIKSKTVVIL